MSPNFIVTNAMTLTAITKTTNFTDVSVGDLISYTMVFSNAGPSDVVAGSATITDTLIISPAGSGSLTLATIASTPVIPFAVNPGDPFGATPVTLADNFAIAAGELLTLTLHFTVTSATSNPVMC